MTARPGILRELWIEPRQYSRYEAMTDLLELAGAEGELLTSARELELRWQWPRRRLRAFLEFLEKEDVATVDVVPGRMGAVGTRISLTSSSGERTVRATTTYAAPPLPRCDVENRVDRARCNDLRSSADRVFPPHPPLGVEISVQTTPPRGGDRGPGKEGERRTIATAELSTPHERYAAELAQVLNDAQRENPLIDPDTFSPISVEQKSTREAGLAMLNADIPLEFAKRAAWTEGRRYKPTSKYRQIFSLAGIAKSLIRDWKADRARREQSARHAPSLRVRAAPSQRVHAVPISDVLPSVTPAPRRS